MTQPPAPTKTRKKPGRKKGAPLTERELAARRANTKLSTGPRTDAGKAISSRNAWKNGATSAIAKQSFRNGANSVAQLFGKPCLRTCPMHPDNPDRDPATPLCSLVLDGVTNVGGNCLDKSVYLHAFNSLMDAMAEGSLDGMHAVLASEGAGMLQILSDLRTTIARDGLMVKIPMVDKNGNALRDEDGSLLYGDYRANPLLGALTTMMDKLGISLPEMLATPQSRARAKQGEDIGKGVQGLLGSIMQRAGAPQGNGLPALPHEEGDK